MLALSACVAPNGTTVTPTPGGGVVITPPGAVAFDPTGRWCFQDRRGRTREHIIDAFRGGMTVTGPGGGEYEFRRISAERYEQVNGDAVYLFNSDDTGVFSRDGTRDSAFDVWRCR